MTENEPRIFLCHASDDKARVMELYHQLKEAGYNPWLDKFDLLGGLDWWTEIEKIINDPYNLVVVCLSCESVTKRGVVQQEIARALDISPAWLQFSAAQVDELSAETIAMALRIERMSMEKRHILRSLLRELSD